MMVIVHNASLRAHRRCGTAAARPRQEEAELELQKIHTPHDLTDFFRGITDEVVSRVVRGAPNSSGPMHCALGSSREEPQKTKIEYVES